MSTKLQRNTYPSNHNPQDFECFGPPATLDAQFENCKIADLGCFNQDGVDSNKYYHGAVVKSRKTGRWFTYFEWGRTGRANPDFLFIECSSESEAQHEFSKQLHSKNDGRGMWTQIAGIRTLTARPGKDCYLVRPQATRSTGLPDARTIQLHDGRQSAPPPPAAPTQGSIPIVTPTKGPDKETLRLLMDLDTATVDYTRGAMADSSIPTQQAIDEGRTILLEAQRVVARIGQDINVQVNDHDIKMLTSHLYGRIPKIKRVGADPSTWILTQENIQGWSLDLDAFEQALYSTVQAPKVGQANPLTAMGIDMAWIDPNSEEGKRVIRWAPAATRGKHGYGRMKIHNVWKVSRPATVDIFNSEVARVGKDVLGKPRVRPLHQTTPDKKEYQAAHVCQLFHGTRSVNVSGILRTDLRLPKELVGVAINGALLGPGLYWADDWMKSAGYTSTRNATWSRGAGGVAKRHAFMFIANVIVGHAHTADHSKGYTQPPRGSHSVFGKAGHTDCGGWKLMNNEWITYAGGGKTHQLDYLLEFQT